MAQDTVYNGAQVTVTIDGQIVEAPAPDADFVTINHETDRVTSAADVEGGVALSVLKSWA